MEIKAVKPGTSIVKVSYGKTRSNGKDYEPISKLNESYVVIDVVEDKNHSNGISLDTNIDIRSYDTVYYYKGSTKDYSFHVDAKGHHSLEVKINGKTIDGKNNNYTVPLENRDNIVEIIAKNNNGTEKLYYVISARKIELIIKNLSKPGQAIGVDDEVEVSFKGITPPVYKLATIYNPTWYRENDPWGSTSGTTVNYENDELGVVKTHKPSQYGLARKNAIKFTVKEEKSHEFTGGHIASEWWGSPLGTDKKLMEPGDPNMGANTISGKFSEMPDFTIDVGKKVDIPVTSVKITSDANTIEVKETLQLDKQVLPKEASQKEVAWTSSDNSIASVDANGLVTGHKEGEATITASSNSDPSVKDRVKVNVKEELEVDGIRISEAELDQNKYDVYYYLDGTSYFLDGKLVKFINENQVKSDGKIIDFNNKKVSYTINDGEKLKAGDKVNIVFDKLDIPIGSVSGEWNSAYQGTIQTIYKTDIPGLGKIQSENYSINSLTFKLPEGIKGTYNLTKSRIYEKANQWSPGIEGIGIEGKFGKLPDITIKVE